jgi:hypothetical protein
MSGYIECYERVLGYGRRSGTQYTFYCPFPTCEDYKGRKFYVDPANGLFYCHHCNEGGNSKMFIEKMGDDESLWPSNGVDTVVEKPKKLSAKEVRKVWSSLIGWATLLPEHGVLVRERGIDPVRAGYVSSTYELLQKMVDHYGVEKLVHAGLGYEARDGSFVAHRCVDVGRILIPYFDKDVVRYFVGWMKCPEKESSQTEEEYQKFKKDWVKCAPPANYPTQLYGTIPQDAELVIVTEGQVKAESAIQRGFVCVGLAGMGSSHKPLATECAKKNAKRVMILFDTQAENQANVDHEADRLARELLKKGLPVYRASLPLLDEVDEGQKIDIDSFLRVRSLAEFIAVLREARLYMFEDSDDAETDEVEEVEDTVVEE